jgi:hypothetical protein
MLNGRLSLGESMRLASDCLRQALAQSLATVEDPLRLNLPPLLTAAGQAPDAATLRVMAALYFQAELEQAGVIPVAESLAAARRTLEVRSASVSHKLEDFATRSRKQWYDRQSRSVTFARLFGAGMAANLQDSAVNRDFQQRLAALCFALTNYQRDYFWGQTPGPTREAALRETARVLLFNLGPRQYGNLPNAARLIQEQMRAAIDLLNDPDLAVLFRARGMWEVLRQVLGRAAPDLGRLVTRGQTGLRLLNWLASVIPALSGPALSNQSLAQPLLPADSPVYTWAAAWLAATGIETASNNARR